MQQAALLGMAVLLAFVLGCDGGNGQEGREVKPPDSGPVQPTKKPEPLPKPNIDVVLQTITLPARVNRGQEFNLTLEAKNNTLGSPPAGVANVEIRASLTGPTGGSNIPIGAAQFRDLQPNEPQTHTIIVRAPNKIGLWTVKAVVSPFDFVDESNNDIEKQLAVD